MKSQFHAEFGIWNFGFGIFFQFGISDLGMKTNEYEVQSFV
jgi:hypothetical protein